MTRNRIVVTLESKESIDCSPTVFLLYKRGSLLDTYYSEDEVTRELERIFESLARDLDILIAPAELELSLSNIASQEYEVIGICEGEREIRYSIRVGLAPHKDLSPKEIDNYEEDVNEDNGIDLGL